MARKGHTYPALQLAVIIRRRKEVPGRWAEPLEGGENSWFFSPSNIQRGRPEFCVSAGFDL